MNRQPTWTPREVKLLRTVLNRNQRDFAKRLGYSQRSVVTWEKPDRDSALQTDTIDVLNTELGRLSPEQRDLFDRERNVTAGRLGAGSATRTAVLLDAAGDGLAPAVPYAPPEPIEDAVRGFVTSSARVFLVTGAAGTGKTTFIEYLARQFGPSIDCQLLTLASWELATVDVAAEILRYASIPRGDDALLSLESHSAQLTRPCLVVIDGIATHEAFAAIGRQVDAILRQVTTSALRFVLTVRSPRRSRPPPTRCCTRPCSRRTTAANTPATTRSSHGPPLKPGPVGIARPMFHSVDSPPECSTSYAHRCT